MSVRCSITFTGTVQGVGFRYTTVNVARKFNITGWVRNEADGSVRCLVEGERDEIDRFIAAVQQAMHGYIRDTQIETAPATGEYRGFTIRR